jgi:methylase of polypeptide subunit release factors
MIINATSFVHTLLRAHLQHGNTAIDATIGNGWDTVVLAELVGNSGTVYGFDIQQVALDVTNSRLRTANYTAKLFIENHANMANVLPQECKGNVHAITFNLGYLPGGDKCLTTTTETTIEALVCGLEMLAHRGIITVVCYQHPEGIDELQAIRRWLQQQPQDIVVCTETHFLNQRGTPPIVVTISKL